MAMKFSDKVAVVTGGGEGIGFEIARQLAQGGASVLLNDLDAARAQKAAASIVAEGGICRGVGGDVAEADTVQSLVSTAVDEYGRLDIAVANAGYSLFKDFLDITPDDFLKVVTVNLSGTFFLAQAAARQMIEQGEGGRLLFLSSVTGRQGFADATVYGMSKRGIAMLARSIAIALGPEKITVNAVAPGATATPRTMGEDPEYEVKWNEVTPTRRLSYPDDIASAALFFLSSEAKNVTGQTLVIDGGWTLTSPIP